MEDNSNDNLQELEDSLAEEYAAEDGGTGLSYYDESGYNYDDSSELTDIDFSNDDSSLYTSSGTGTDAFDPVARNEENEEDDEEENTTHNYGNTSRTVTTENYVDDYEDEEPDDFDGEYDDEKENDDENDSDASPVNNHEKNGEYNQEGQINADQDYSGVIDWKPGRRITLDLFNQVWRECRDVQKLWSLMTKIDKTIMEDLSTFSEGPNLILKLNKYVHSLGDSLSRPTDALLDLTFKSNKRLLYTTFAVAEALFDQEWLQVPIIATLSTNLNLIILRNNPLFTRFMETAVPLVNKKYSKPR